VWKRVDVLPKSIDRSSSCSASLIPVTSNISRPSRSNQSAASSSTGDSVWATTFVSAVVTDRTNDSVAPSYTPADPSSVSSERTFCCSVGETVSVCVCVCVRARACVCACVRACARRARVTVLVVAAPAVAAVVVEVVVVVVVVVAAVVSGQL
jgi:hypothetical protein